MDWKLVSKKNVKKSLNLHEISLHFGLSWISWAPRGVFLGVNNPVLFDERSHLVPKRASGGLWKRFWKDFGRICRGIWEDFGDRGVHFGRTWKGFGDLWIHLERNMVSAIFLLKSAAPYKWTSAKLEFAVRFTMHWNPTLWNRRFDHYCAAPSRRHSKNATYAQ